MDSTRAKDSPNVVEGVKSNSHRSNNSQVHINGGVVYKNTD